MADSEGENDLSEAIGRVKRDALDLADALESIADRSAEDLNRAAQSLREVAENYYAQYAERAQEKPLASMLQWAEVGFLLGWLFGKSKGPHGAKQKE